MTKNMIAVMEKLYRSKENTGWVVYSTAVALEHMGLVLPPRKQRTGGRGFPRYLLTLSAKGKAFCLRHDQL